jgi:hypothetical protein
MNRLALASLFLATLLMLLFALPGGASTTAVSAEEPGSCGTADFDVPDTGDSFDFTAACAAHDACYIAGGGPLARARCDRAFYADMLDWCTSHWQPGDPRLGRCKLVATTYYAGVRLGGWLTFYIQG